MCRKCTLASVLSGQFLALALAACAAPTVRPVGINCGPVSEAWSPVSQEERLKQFARYSLEYKYAAMICGNQLRHPPDLGLSAEMAKLGPDAAYFLMHKLAAANDDLIIRDIVIVFSLMQALGTYDVAENDVMMGLMEEKVAQMQDPDWKSIVSEDLDGIRASAQ